MVGIHVVGIHVMGIHVVRIQLTDLMGSRGGFARRYGNGWSVADGPMRTRLFAHVGPTLCWGRGRRGGDSVVGTGCADSPTALPIPTILSWRRLPPHVPRAAHGSNPPTAAGIWTPARAGQCLNQFTSAALGPLTPGTVHTVSSWEPSSVTMLLGLPPLALRKMIALSRPPFNTCQHLPPRPRHRCTESACQEYCI